MSEDDARQKAAFMKHRAERLAKGYVDEIAILEDFLAGWNARSQPVGDEAERAEHCFKCNRHELKCVCEPHPGAQADEGEKVRSCNMHKDCDAANAKAVEQGIAYAEHCHDEDCEDCFGK